MMRLVAEAWLALIGAWRALTFKSDWDQNFDLSVRGLWHSFFAAMVALPLVIFILTAVQHLGTDLQPVHYYVRYAISWLVFPVAAAGTVALLGVRQSFVPWLILHNWTVVLLYGLLTLFWALRTAGIIDQTIHEVFVFFYFYLRILVHWRVAFATLGVPTITSALAASVPMLAQSLSFVLLDAAFAPPVEDQPG